MENLKKILLFTTKGCSHCKIGKAFFERIGIPYEEKNLEDIDVAAELVMNNIAVYTAPILAINGLVFQFGGELR